MKIFLPLLFLILTTGACRTTRSGSDTNFLAQPPTPRCEGKTISICQFPLEYELDQAIALVLGDVERAEKSRLANMDPLAAARVACAEVSYPGNEAAVRSEAKQRGTFICLFNSQYTMNVALNRLSTFIEDFETVDELPNYSDQSWVTKQKENGTLGHNLESPDLEKYLTETRKYISRRAQSPVLGIKMETEFMDTYIKAKLNKLTGKPQSIFLGVFMPALGTSKDPAAELKATLGHEIFHSLYFHSTKMRQLVKTFIDAAPAADVKAIKTKLLQKGYDVENSDGTPPSPKQVYMFYNEAQAYMLESGACTDGAFVRYEDDTAAEPTKPLAGHAPLVVKYAAPLRKSLLAATVISPAWSAKWSPDLVALGCKN